MSDPIAAKFARYDSWRHVQHMTWIAKEPAATGVRESKLVRASLWFPGHVKGSGIRQ